MAKNPFGKKPAGGMPQTPGKSPFASAGAAQKGMTGGPVQPRLPSGNGPKPPRMPAPPPMGNLGGLLSKPSVMPPAPAKGKKAGVKPFAPPRGKKGCM